MNEQKASTLGPAFWLSFSIALSAGMAWQTEHTCDAGWLELYLIGLIFWTIPSIVVGFLVASLIRESQGLVTLEAQDTCDFHSTSSIRLAE